MKNVLVLCTGNSCRSQIAEGSTHTDVLILRQISSKHVYLSIK